MPKPPEALYETAAEYDWRISQWYPQRYPFDASKHPEFFEKAKRRFYFWWRVGEVTGWWGPLVRCAQSLHLCRD